VLDRLAVCSEQDARRLDSTLLVIARTGPHAGWIGETAERLIRGCSLPMLFVPEEISSQLPVTR
jgi:nucleotide-binding universal stress UspA family protein